MFCGSVSAGYGSIESVSACRAEVTRTSERWSTPAALPRHGLCANRSYSTSFIQPNLKGDYSMKKLLSIFVALAMVLSLFAGVGARSAKADTTFNVTPAGNFVGGVNGSGVLGVDAIGTVTVATYAYANVTVTTAGVGTFDGLAGNVTVTHAITGLTSADSDWAIAGDQWIAFNDTTKIKAGQTISVPGSSTDGVGTVISIASSTLAYVNVSTAALVIIGSAVMTTYEASTTDVNWRPATVPGPTGAASISFVSPAVVSTGDAVDVPFVQAVPAVSATAFLMVSGTVTAGQVVTVTWQDTAAASHTVSYTAVAGDDATSVALVLKQLINALTTGNVTAALASATVIQLTQDVAGAAGNGKTLTATTTASVTPTLTVHTLGGLTQPAYVENGKTIQLVATDSTGAVVTATWTCVGATAPAGPSAIISTTGLVTANLALTGVSLVTATSGTATGVFAVIVIPVQTVTSLKINLVPAVPVSITKQQFGAIASNAAYSALDYTTQAVWTDMLPVASITATTGLLTYSTDETGNVNAYAGGTTATANVKITAGVVTLVVVVGPVTRVIVLTIGTDIVTVDGKATSVDAPPEIVEGRTFVPIRFIAETFGSTVTWLPETKGVTIVLGDTTIGLQIGNKTVVINSTIIALEAAPYIKNSRTMVPLRVISESFGGDVAWDPAFRTITITYVLPVAPLVPLVP